MVRQVKITLKKKKSNKKEREKNKETQKTAEYNEKRDSVRSLY